VPDDLSFEFRGTNRVANVLRKFASQFPEIVDKPMGAWAQRSRGVLKSTPYPKKNTERWRGRWASDKQRRYVMAAIRRGDIRVPYQRTGGLANRWSAARIKPGLWTIKNSAPYAIWVVSQDDQHKIFHKGRWWIAYNELGKLTIHLVRDISAEIGREWEKGGGTAT
jgi:hypothetical protein